MSAYRIGSVACDGEILISFSKETRIIGHDGSTLLLSQKVEEDKWARGPFCPMCDFLGLVEEIKVDGESIKFPKTVYVTSMDRVGGTLFLSSSSCGGRGSGGDMNDSRPPYCPLCDRR